MLIKGYGVSPAVIIAVALVSIATLLYATAHIGPAAGSWAHGAGKVTDLAKPAYEAVVGSKTEQHQATESKSESHQTQEAKPAELGSTEGAPSFFGENEVAEIVPLCEPAHHASTEHIPALAGQYAPTHNEVNSSSITKDGRFFPLKFGSYPAINPNIIPHPETKGNFIIVAQQHKRAGDNQAWCAELVCEAEFKDGVLQCLVEPLNLIIGHTTSTKCEGKLAMLELNIGPHDARVFYGPDHPFIIYGSQSKEVCFGQWVQDFRLVTDWRYDFVPVQFFKERTDMSRPPPYHLVEKNYFLFWDDKGEMYAHHDVAPSRVFAKLYADGSVGPDLAPQTREHDEKCMSRYVAVERTLDHIHQATNSLALVLCSQSSPDCHKTPENTVIMEIFQQKSFIDGHAVYEPFVMLFESRAPFQMHGVSAKPLWINGRRENGFSGEWPPEQSEMVYVTSMNWKEHGKKYTGYLDDKVMLGFGIEDKATGGMDVTARDLLRGMGYCSESGVW
ncbi:hypothetical protein B0A48_11937 [Cryoendolithus antarcticus]|uniref:Uncharacterized protein n=1 Tax=Cryoendolithus antarcticus TaxID=1507870 RepID=A0A1V8ST88_9PEZI|nr:hypothetical protein B0A48_11937 [Cryoendolithus antarcticus]